MQLFERFSHYLAYGATDQETFRQLRGAYTGVLVPATIAAWQRQGTGGFVLTLSATPEAPPYVIDPRFPLFQQALINPKVSHQALAELLGDASLIQPRDPTPDMFTDQRLVQLARNWIEFNRGYGSSSSEKFDKYAERLGEAIVPDQAQGPEAVLAPYFACAGEEDPWWTRSKRFFELSREVCADPPCLRVVCTRQSSTLRELFDDIGSREQVVVWVSGLDEHQATVTDLGNYRDALALAQSRGQETFALYGGFFSVLLGAVGLYGAAHGIGFSESRNWVELPQSGAPPARYYLREIHRYVPQDLAQALRERTRDLARCPCETCDGRAPNELEYHDLMKHSVWCRRDEIDEWYGRDLRDASRHMKAEHERITGSIRGAGLLPAIRARAIGLAEHLLVWADALAG